jgi:hypothetical protein
MRKFENRYIAQYAFIGFYEKGSVISLNLYVTTDPQGDIPFADFLQKSI